jgi:hypothetical protein
MAPNLGWTHLLIATTHWPFAKCASYCFGVNVFFEERPLKSKTGLRVCLTCENACISEICAFNASLTSTCDDQGDRFDVDDVYLLSLCLASVVFPSNAYGDSSLDDR